MPDVAFRVMLRVRLTMLNCEQNASMIESTINNLMNKMRAGLVDVKMISADENTWNPIIPTNI